MTAKDTAKHVQDLLRNLKGLDPLKQLFWSELNYERVNDPLSRRDWTATASSVLAEDPLLFASGGADKDFHVIYSRLDSPNLQLGLERPVINKLIQQGHSYALFVFSNLAQDQWHFVNVRYDREESKRQVFRRIAIASNDEGVRTPSERLSLLDLATIGEDSSALEIQTVHDEAFDVERVTNDFFRDYATVFDIVKEQIRLGRGVRGALSDEVRHDFAQRLMNRLLFLCFLQKKGWMDSKPNYMFEYYEKCVGEGRNFYADYLQHILFNGLNNPNGTPPKGMSAKVLKDLIGDIPFLNGGLFEEMDEWDRPHKVEIGNEVFDEILGEDGLLRVYNFTVTESTPLDVQVAVDPEMLGKVFERLITGRRETGSYYTPKTIVSFMCRESLKRFLGGYESLVDKHDTSGITIPFARRLLEQLAHVHVVDPACGSGAYLVGMMHELHMLLRTLDTRIGEGSARDDYMRKLRIIQENLYGVDIDNFAVNIARLRLWLSLVVEYDGNNPPPLPNLDFKIEVGDSLTAPAPSGLVQPDLIRHQLIEKFYQLKSSHIQSHGQVKKELKT